MAKQVGTMEFWYKDYNEDEFNHSIDCTFDVWDNLGLGMSMEQYYNYCKYFALAMGFSEELVNDWFCIE